MPTPVNTRPDNFTFELLCLFARFRASACVQAREEALNLLLEQEFFAAIRKQVLGELRARLGADSAAYSLVRENIDSTICCALVQRFDHIALFRPEVSSLAYFVARQVVYHFNDHERDWINHMVGYVRGAQDQRVSFCALTFTNDQGEEEELPVAAEGLSHETLVERKWEQSWFQQRLQFQNDQGTQWLKIFLEHDVLDEDCPAVWLEPGVIQLRWKHQGQKRLAEALGVTTRTLRNHTRKVEETLSRWAMGIQDLPEL